MYSTHNFANEMTYPEKSNVVISDLALQRWSDAITDYSTVLTIEEMNVEGKSSCSYDVMTIVVTQTDT